MEKVFADGVAAKIGEALRRIGYAHVTLDLLGYRRGSLNERVLIRPPGGTTAAETA
jgi:PP-loop superfamily ATP-utilizing enzyme